MPRRSNEFQRLIRLLESHLYRGNQSVVVEESAMLIDSHTGLEREVDVVIRFLSQGTPLVIGIECRDQQRKADVPWVEGQFSKHTSLPTSRLLLASRCGFTKSALQKAAALGLQTIDYSEGVPEGAGDLIIGHNGSIWVKEIVAIDCALELKIENRIEDRWVEVPNGAQLVDQRGDHVMVAFELVRPLLSDSMEYLRNRTQIGAEGDISEFWSFEGAVPEKEQPILLPFWDRESVGEHPQFALEVVGFRAHGSVTFRSVPVDMSEAMIDGVPMSWGHFSVRAGNGRTIAISEIGGVPQITVTDNPAGANSS